jgi:hypothetical protein
MLRFPRIGGLLVFMALIGCAMDSASAAEFITQRCKDYRHPEIRFEVSDDTPVEDAQWLIATLENMVSQGSKFRAGETIQFGWMVNRFEGAKGGTLRLLEPPMWSTAPADYQPSMTNTLYYLRRQKDTVESLEGGLPIVFPSMLQNALVHKDYSTLRTLTILREAPKGADSGWRLLKNGDMPEVLDETNYRTLSLFDLAVHGPNVAHLFALPPGTAIKIGMDLQKSYFFNSQSLTIRPDSYVARMNAKYVSENAELAASRAPSARTSRGVYQERLQQHAMSQWQDVTTLSDQEWCVVNVTLASDGKLLAHEFLDCPNREAVRESVKEALSASSPFPPPDNAADFSATEPIVFKRPRTQ